MAECGKFWTTTETRVLINVWRQDSIQKLLRDAKRNDAVYGKIVEALAKRNYHRTVQQCRAKIKALKRKYKEIVDRLRKSGEGRESDEERVPADFPFFDDIDAVMGGRDTVSPVHLLDSADTQPLLDADDDTVDFPEVPDAPLSASTSSSSRPDTPAGVVFHFTDTPIRSSPSTIDSGLDNTLQPDPVQVLDAPTSPQDKAATDTPGPSNKRIVDSSRKISSDSKKRKKSKLQKAEESADAFMSKGLSDQDKRRAEWAEMERQQMEFALKQAERESERDRQFMLQMQQMMAMVVQSVAALPHTHPPPYLGNQPGPGYPQVNQLGPGYHSQGYIGNVPGPNFFPGSSTPVGTSTPNPTDGMPTDSSLPGLSLSDDSLDY